MSDKENIAFEPLKSIGIFLIVFGLATMGAALLEMPTSDKMINAVSGLVILSCGGLAFYLGLKRTVKNAGGGESSE